MDENNHGEDEDEDSKSDGDQNDAIGDETEGENGKEAYDNEDERDGG